MRDYFKSEHGWSTDTTPAIFWDLIDLSISLTFDEMPQKWSSPSKIEEIFDKSFQAFIRRLNA